MSLQCPVGPEGNVLTATAEHARRLILPHPVLTLTEMAALQTWQHKGWKTTTLDATLPLSAAKASPNALRDALVDLSAKAEAAVLKGGAPLLVLSHRAAGPDRLPIPSLLATGAVHQRLVAAKARAMTGLLVETGDAKEPHDFCTLLGFGADGICPYGAYAAVSAFHGDPSSTADGMMMTYRKAAGKAILKVMSKIGICTVQSYRGAQIFEAVGFGPEVRHAPQNTSFCPQPRHSGDSTFSFPTRHSHQRPDLRSRRVRPRGEGSPNNKLSPLYPQP